MATMAIGFILTGVLGTGLTQYFMHRRDQDNIRSVAVITRKEAVKELSHLMAARQLQAQLFVKRRYSARARPGEYGQCRLLDYENLVSAFAPKAVESHKTYSDRSGSMNETARAVRGAPPPISD